MSGFEYPSTYPDLGTASTKDVPAAGDAAAGQVVLGNDSRLGVPAMYTGKGTVLGATGAGAPSPVANPTMEGGFLQRSDLFPAGAGFGKNIGFNARMVGAGGPYILDDGKTLVFNAGDTDKIITILGTAGYHLGSATPAGAPWTGDLQISDDNDPPVTVNIVAAADIDAVVTQLMADAGFTALFVATNSGGVPKIANKRKGMSAFCEVTGGSLVTDLGFTNPATSPTGNVPFVDAVTDDNINNLVQGSGFADVYSKIAPNGKVIIYKKTGRDPSGYILFSSASTGDIGITADTRFYGSGALPGELVSAAEPFAPAGGELMSFDAFSSTGTNSHSMALQAIDTTALLVATRINTGLPAGSGLEAYASGGKVYVRRTSGKSIDGVSLSEAGGPFAGNTLLGFPFGRVFGDDGCWDIDSQDTASTGGTGGSGGGGRGGGGLPAGFTNAATPYTFGTNNEISLINAVAGASVVNLPDAKTFATTFLGGDTGLAITVKNVSGSNCSLTPAGTDTIDGVNAAVVLAAWGVLRLLPYSTDAGATFNWAKV